MPETGSESHPLLGVQRNANIRMGGVHTVIFEMFVVNGCSGDAAQKPYQLGVIERNNEDLTLRNLHKERICGQGH